MSVNSSSNDQEVDKDDVNKRVRLDDEDRIEYETSITLVINSIEDPRWINISKYRNLMTLDCREHSKTQHNQEDQEDIRFDCCDNTTMSRMMEDCLAVVSIDCCCYLIHSNDLEDDLVT